MPHNWRVKAVFRCRAVNRFYRFLRDDRFDNWLLTEHLFSFFAHRRTIILSLDRTSWGERFSVLTASVAVSAVKKRLLVRSQNLWEETFLRLCADRLKQAQVKAIWLCDRGFHRVEWLITLRQLKQSFVVRLKRDLLVEIDNGKVLLKNIQLTRGEYRDFGFVRLRSDGKVRVRLISVRAKQASEIWWLATNLNLSAAQIVGLYDRRMSIEQQFRDTKGTHFGLKMKWTCFERGQYLERMFLLIGVAMLVHNSIATRGGKGKSKSASSMQIASSVKTVTAQNRHSLLAQSRGKDQTNHKIHQSQSAAAESANLSLAHCSAKVISAQKIRYLIGFC